MGIHKGSHAATLLEMAVGERRYYDTTFEKYSAESTSRLVPRSRRPPELEGREFTIALFTAVGAASAADVRYLLCLERIK